MWTFKQVYDKLTTAYIAGKVNPYDPCACFVGNMLGGTASWQNVRDYSESARTGKGCLISPVDDFLSQREAGELSIKFHSEGTFTTQEIADIEAVFMHTFYVNGINHRYFRPYDNPPNYDEQKIEEVLWQAFVNGLDKVKEVFESKGLPTEERVFPKRWLKETV